MGSFQLLRLSLLPRHSYLVEWLLKASVDPSFILTGCGNREDNMLCIFLLHKVCGQCEDKQLPSCYDPCYDSNFCTCQMRSRHHLYADTL